MPPRTNISCIIKMILDSACVYKIESNDCKLVSHHILIGFIQQFPESTVLVDNKLLVGGFKFYLVNDIASDKNLTHEQKQMLLLKSF